jgi:hypothetical protein
MFGQRMFVLVSNKLLLLLSLRHYTNNSGEWSVLLCAVWGGTVSLRHYTNYSGEWSVLLCAVWGGTVSLRHYTNYSGEWSVLLCGMWGRTVSLSLFRRDKVTLLTRTGIVVVEHCSRLDSCHGGSLMWGLRCCGGVCETMSGAQRDRLVQWLLWWLVDRLVGRLVGRLW